MALPVAPGPRTQDVAVSGWGPLTVRVAWTLLACGVNIRPQVLRDARDHLLYHLDPSATVAHAEDQADIHTRRFVANARRQRLDEQWPQDWAMPLSPRWRDALERTLTPLTQAVLRQHYADARPMADLASALQVDRITLEGARGGLREVVRHAACTDGVPLDEWPVERLDKLIARLAAFTPTRCPDPRTLPEAERGRHASYCPRCSRTLRLLAAEVLSDGDLEPPLGTARPRHHCTVLALNLHPDGRQHRKTLVREADFPCFPAGEDLLLMDWTSPGEATELLVLATQVATPRREHLRGVVLSGPGRWSRHGLLGPLATEAERAVRSRA